MFIVISCGVFRKKSDTVLTVDISSPDTSTTEVDPNLQVMEADKSQWLAVYIPPALYLSASSLIIADKIKRCSNQEVILISTGFSSVLTALYSMYGSVQKVEWTLYQLTKELNGAKAYSRKWKKTLTSFLSKSFKDIEFSDLKIPLVINLFNKNGDIREYYKGEILPILRAAINDKYVRGFQFESAKYSKLFANIYVDRLLPKYKIAINPYQDNLIFAHDHGYLWGKYAKLAYAFNQNAKEFTAIFPLENKLPIDEVNHLSKFFGKHYSQEKICQLIPVDNNAGSAIDN